jgi:multidrug resistance protein
MNHPTQKYLGPKGLVILIALLSAFVPLSTDLYLPALPGMSTYFHVGIEKINLTLTFFFIFYAAGTLIWGPLSDRYGRKPILLIGLSIYVAASVFCSLTDSLVGLIVCRILQATGGSAAGAVATAIVKDSYSGRQRESVLAIVSSMVTISPAVAPVLGAFLLKVMSWRGIFWSLAIIGAVALIGTLFFEESIEQRNSTRLFQSFARMGVVLQNMRFTALLIVFSIINIASMAFISGSTYIYQDFFGERARTDRRSDDLSLAVAHVQARKDHPGLLWIFDPERPADLILRAAPTLDAYAVRAPELGGWEYCPASGFEPDARSAEIRYRLGLFADELRRPVDEQPGDDPDHAALGKHGADPGSHGADHRDDRFRRLAIRFSICLTGIHRSRSG